VSARPTTRRRALALLVFAPAAAGPALAGAQATADSSIVAAGERALALRDEAVRRGDQPYGAVVVKDGRIVGEGVSAVVTSRDPDAHAERIALRDAAARLSTADLSGCVLVGSSRACGACSDAAFRARIARLWHGARPVDDGPPRPSG
jgi:tRNA(Arg) A34 adenosine deaminase TadA